MLKQLIQSNTVDVESKIRSLPRTFNLGDFYSGAGTFFLIVEAITKAFQAVAPNPAEELEASIGNIWKKLFQTSNLFCDDFLWR